jgi:hypothetical protein
MRENLTLIERKVLPIANMAETVKVCKENIGQAMESINKVANGIKEAEDVCAVLSDRKGEMINNEFDEFIQAMSRCRELVSFFEGELTYFKDSYDIAEKLV